jgi:hypothetical protein
VGLINLSKKEKQMKVQIEADVIGTEFISNLEIRVKWGENVETITNEFGNKKIWAKIILKILVSKYTGWKECFTVDTYNNIVVKVGNMRTLTFSSIPSLKTNRIKDIDIFIEELEEFFKQINKEIWEAKNQLETKTYKIKV